MARNTAKLGGAASDVVIAKVAVSHGNPLTHLALTPFRISLNVLLTVGFVWRPQHGLMRMTWKPTPIPDEEAFASIKAGIDALPPGVKMFLNSGECVPRCFIIFDRSRLPKLARVRAFVLLTNLPRLLF